jgi:hypothetical protein
MKCKRCGAGFERSKGSRRRYCRPCVHSRQSRPGMPRGLVEVPMRMWEVENYLARAVELEHAPAWVRHPVAE